MTSDKSYATEKRLNALINELGTGVIPNADGNNYEIGVMTVRTSGTQAFTSSVQAVVNGLTGNIGVGSYAFESWIDFTADASIVGLLTMGGTATVSTIRAFVHTTGNQITPNYKVQTVFGTNTGVDFPLTSGSSYLTVIRGHLTCTAAGNLSVFGATSGGAGFTTHIRSVLRYWPTIS